ncbi:MAG: GlsB/YeaQ/YmgE family stress response membrane protein [Bacteroidota bacterium]
MEDLNLIKIGIMVLVGALAGTLAARIMKGDNFGFVVNAILGIAGAVVGGTIFDFLGLTPGKGIVKTIDSTFGVTLPQNLVGMIVSATLGSILILWFFRILRKGRR